VNPFVLVALLYTAFTDPFSRFNLAEPCSCIIAAMAPRSNKVVAKGASKSSSKAAAIGDQTRRTSRVRKTTPKAQLHAGSGASAQQASRNASRRRPSPPRPSPPRSASPPSNEHEEEEEGEEEDLDYASADAQLAALRVRAKAVAKEISIQKHRRVARDALAAQELQLHNLTMGDTRLSSTFPLRPPSKRLMLLMQGA